MSFFMLDTDGTSVREAYNIYVKPSDEVKRVRKIYAYDNENDEVRLVFNSHTEFLLAGEATPLAAGTKEIVEFGVDTDFNAGIQREIEFTIADTTINQSFTGTVGAVIDSETFNKNTGLTYIPERNRFRYDGETTTYISYRTNISFDVDNFVDTASSNLFVGYLAEFDDSEDMTAEYKSGIRFGLTTISASTTSVNSTRSSVTSDFTLTKGKEYSIILGWSTIDSITDSMDASNIRVKWVLGSTSDFGSGVSSYSISNTSHSIPAIIGSFDTEANVETARANLKTALENDVEFTELFEHDTDTKIIFSDSEAAELFYITMDFSETAINTVNTPTTGDWRFYPGTGGGYLSTGYVNVPHKTTSETITNATELVNYLVETYNNASSAANHWGIATGNAGIMTVTLQPNEKVNDLIFVGIDSFDTDVFQNSFDATMGVNGTTFGDVNSGSSTRKRESIFGSFRNQNFNTIPKLVTRWRSKTDSDIEDFTYAITQGSGENTTPYLGVSQEGANPIVGTVVNITNPNEAINVSVSMTDNVGNEIANSSADLTYDADTNVLKGNPDTTISITNPNTLTITEQ